MAWNPRALVSKTFKIVAKDGPHLTVPAPHERRAVRARHPSDAPPPVSAVRQAIVRTRQWLLEQQHPDGYWVGELEGDTILESEYILLLAWLGREQAAASRASAPQHLLDKQLPDGGWAMYPGGQLEISGSVKAYFALKLTGHDPDARADAAGPRGDPARTAAPTR